MYFTGAQLLILLGLVFLMGLFLGIGTTREKPMPPPPPDPTDSEENDIREVRVTVSWFSHPEEDDHILGEEFGVVHHNT